MWYPYQMDNMPGATGLRVNSSSLNLKCEYPMPYLFD